MATRELNAPKTVLGIDLGASYLKAVYTRTDNEDLIPILNDDGSSTFRVCAEVSATDQLLPLTTDAARRDVLRDRRRILENVKPHRGTGGIGKGLEIAILRKALERYRSESGDRDLSSLGRVVLTHPVSPRPDALHELREIAEQAGLPRDRLDFIEEPVALALFATRARPNLTGRVLVVDAGHYTTDLVVAEFRNGATQLHAGEYLGLRLGVGELLHGVAMRAWLKAQWVGGAIPATAPFSEHGPESDLPVVRQLLGWAETEIVRALEFPLFGPDIDARLDLCELDPTEIGTWATKVPNKFINFYYDETSTRTFDPDGKGFAHLPQDVATTAIRAASRLTYADAVQPIIRGLSAAISAVVYGLNDPSDLQVVLAGGLMLVPEVRLGIEAVLARLGLSSPLDIGYQYPGLPPSAVGMARLLAVAAGAAVDARSGLLAGSARHAGDSAVSIRHDTLSDAIGLVAWYGLEDFVTLMEENDLLPDGFPPEDQSELENFLNAISARVHPTSGGGIAPLHRQVAPRGRELPCVFEFPDEIVAAAGGGTLLITRYGEDRVRSIALLGRHAGPTDVLAEVPVPAGLTGLRLSLEVRRNDDWQLRLTDSAGRVVVNEQISLRLLNRGESENGG